MDIGTHRHSANARLSWKQREARTIESPNGIQSDAAPSSREEGRVTRPSGGRAAPHPVFWIIAAALVVIAGAEFLRDRGPDWSGVALGQPVSSGGARGVFAFSGQLSKNSFGVYLVDVDAMTMWVYEFTSPKNCLRLAAARTWRYDRYLENHNICDLPPEVVEEMIEQQRRYRLQASEDENP